MKISVLVRAATALLLTIGMTGLGATAAFADDTTPPPAPAADSAPPASAPDPAPAPAPDPAPAPAPDPAPADPPASDPPASDPPASDPPASDPSTTDDTQGAPTPAGPGTLTVAKPSTKTSRTDVNVAAQNFGEVYLCHATQGANPWISEHPNAQAAYNGHVAPPNNQNDHLTDIIPPFDYNDQGNTVHYAGKNLSTDFGGGITGQMILDNNCVVPTTVTPAASATPQTCKDGALVGGKIQLTVIAGVTYTIKSPSNQTVPFNASGLTGKLSPGVYTISFTHGPGVFTTVTSPFTVTIVAFTGPCAPPVVSYVTVAWLAPGGAPPHHFDVPQTYLFSEETASPALDTLDDEIAAYLATLKCGSTIDIQVDVYYDDSTTDSLIAGGILYGPSNPPEHLIPGGLGTAWKFVHLDSPPCPKVVPVIPTVKDLCGTDNDHYGLPANVTGITYSRDGLDIVASLTGDYVWGTLPAGWVDNGDGTATYAFSNHTWDRTPCPIIVTPVAPTPKDLCGTDNDHYGLPANVTGITYSRDGLNIVATLAAGYGWGTLPAGYVDNGDGTATYAFSNTTWDQTPCLIKVAPVAPTPKDLCGTDNDHYGLPANVTGISYSRDGLNIVATLAAGYTWDTLPAGYVDNGNGTATYAFSNTTWDETPCLIKVVPVAPTPKDLCGTDNDHYGLPGNATGITYSRSGLDIVATLAAGYAWGTLPAGYVDNGDGTATYAFSNTQWDETPCIEVTPAATPTPQTCVQNVFLTEGSIQLTLNDHVHYTVTGPNGDPTPVTFDATGLSTSVTLPGTYLVSFTLDPGYSAPGVLNPFTVTITAYGDLCDLTTAPLVEPLVTFAPPSCTHDGSYTLANDQTPGAVLWEVNGTPGAIDGTYPAARGTTVTIHAEPAAPLYGFAGGQQQDWTHTFTVPAGSPCDPGFLAFTGDGPRFTWLAVALLTTGLALVLFQARSRREFAPKK